MIAILATFFMKWGPCNELELVDVPLTSQAGQMKRYLEPDLSAEHSAKFHRLIF